MGFSRGRIIKITLTLAFLCCALFVNFFAVRMILRYGVDTYFYDKLLVAYTVGAAKGLKLELDNIPITDKLPRESMLAKDLAARLGTLADPEAFLKDKVQKNKKMVSFVRNLRSAGMIIMFILFGWQLIVNFPARFKSRKPS